MTWKIPLFKIYSDAQDTAAVTAVILSGMYWAEGPAIETFETMVAEYSGSRHAVVFNSGTSALHAALIAHGVSMGDEVIVPSFTFVSTANAPLYVGAKPVFADIEENTCGLDPSDVMEKVTSRTKAIIPVHYGGAACRIRELAEVAEDHGLILIEDAAESFGAEVEGKKVGTFGDSAMFSFCQNKIITTGEGGAIVTESGELADTLRMIRSHGRDLNSQYFSSGEVADYGMLGYNFRMSTITAALGCSQMEKVRKIITRRREIGDMYTNAFREIGGVTPPEEPTGQRHVYQLYSLRCDRRDGLMEFLKQKGIMSKIYFPPVHMTAFYRGMYDSVHLPVTEKVSEDILTIPLYPSMTDEEIGYVIDSVKEYYRTV